MNYIFILITVINAFVFILYGIDKYKAFAVFYELFGCYARHDSF